MSERDHILISLVKEVLGPRNGSNEIMPETQNPRDEYITGVLAPYEAPRPLDDIDADIDEVIEETSSEEDQDNQGYVVVPSVFSPALDPKALPRSIGLSFIVGADSGLPEIEICTTWARYQQHQQGWQRLPMSFLTGPIQVNQNHEWKAAEGILLRLRSVQPASRRGWRVSIFLINITELADKKQASTNDHLFQPQIRVYCCPGTYLLPVWMDDVSNSIEGTPVGSLAAEDASLALLYRERTAMARGHLCGTTWKAIDPERPHSTIPSPNEAPFAWVDAPLVTELERTKFSPADVRTEMVPCYPIEAPQIEWDEDFGLPPILLPEVLAETWQPEQVRDNLQPLIDGYRAWIERQQSSLADLPTRQQSIAEAHLQQCKWAADRMQQAIEILATDEDARLAFCFANKAIALQSRWSRKGQVISWHPFQLAFILLNIPALANPLHPDRGICDLLWFPTGGGKTEAYLGLAAFTLALRRRRAPYSQNEKFNGAGTGVLSRYTLRLLTIQQFRRALGLITACERLRVQNLDRPGKPVGWRPEECPNQETFLWGGLRFSVGLWVGGNVTPNSLLSIGPVPGPNGWIFYAGALDILQGASKDYEGPNVRLQQSIRSSSLLEINGEPAQVLNCPCCGATLAIPDEGFGPGQHTLHFVFQGGSASTPFPSQFQSVNFRFSVDSLHITQHVSEEYRTLSVTFTITEGKSLSARQVDEWWYQIIVPVLGRGVKLMPARPSRPGYFILTYDNSQNNARQCDFDIYCPYPNCELNQHVWAEQVPLNRTTNSALSSNGGQMSLGLIATNQAGALPLIRGLQWQEIPEAFRQGITKWVSNRIPIPAYTVDEQIYHRCPSLVIATVDKFARLAFEPKASALFGNVSYYHSRWGYYREGCPPSEGNLPSGYRSHPSGHSRNNILHVSVPPFMPPDLILQDELHLIEGPLGSMVGLYETVVDLLCQRQEGGQTIGPKYVASTATVRQAEPQVQALFDRHLAQFPPSAISANDRFFARDRNQEIHPLESGRPGRLYVAVCAPGKGAQTPIVRIWSTLLQSVYERWQINHTVELDRFYTLVGYFNAIRELAGALSLYRQDIPERMDFLGSTRTARVRPLDRYLELSSRASSLDLPALLERLKDQAPLAQDVVFATSMFGTGVDVDRLGLMVVHGQPKTTASYIQATGRVGRQGGGLVVTFFRASRPRDLDHYEFFTGYHRALYRYVEPVTVAPFSPRARERGLGPLAVVLLRHAKTLNGQQVHPDWRVQQRLSGAFFAQARHMSGSRHDPEVSIIPQLLEARANQQPAGRRPPEGVTAQEMASELDLWAHLARQNPDPDRFVYNEPALLRSPERHVVLGDAQHRSQNLSQAFENAPQSLREVEETTGFKS